MHDRPVSRSPKAYSAMRIYVIALAIGLAVSGIFWLADSIYGYYQFEPNLRFMLFQEPLSIWDSLVLRVPRHALLSRLAFAVASLAGAAGVAVTMVRWRASNARYETYLASARTGIFVSDSDGNYLEANDAATAQLGYTKEEILSMTIRDLIDPANADAALAHHQSVLEHGEATGEFALIRKDGRRIYAIVDAVGLPDGRLLGMTTETTASHEAREREERQNQLLRMMRGVNQLITQAETRADLLDGVCRYLADAAVYHGAWMVLVDDTGHVTMASSSTEWETPIDQELPQRQDGFYSRYMRASLRDAHIHVARELQEPYGECPTGMACKDLAALSLRLAYRDQVYGVVAVAVSREFADDPKEHQLFREMVGDVAFALYRIDLAKENAAAQRLQAEYAHIVAASHDGLCMVRPDYTYTVANQAYAQIAGATPDAIVGNSVADVLGRDVFEREVRSRLDRCFAGESVLWERWMILADLSERFYQVAYSPVFGASGEVEAAAVRLSDITELRQAERELLDQSKQLDQIIEELPDAAVFSDAHRRITRVNRAFCRIMGYEPEDVIGRTTEFLYADQESYKLMGPRRELNEALLHKATEVDCLSSSGKVIKAEMTGVTLRDADDVPYAFLVLARDIGERKAAEVERAQMEQQLRQAQKMEAVGQLAGGIAHDFNNLLQVIEGYSEFLLDSLPQGSAEQDFAQEIKASADRATMLTRQLLAFSRRQIMAQVVLDLDDLVQNLLKMLGRLIGEHITMVYIPSREPLWVNADSGQIEQILMNLCVNARDAMPDGGSLEIKLDRFELDQAFCHANRWARVGSYAAFSVTDTGTGMDDVVLGQLFEPFFTTKEVGKGTGLGLATVYGIVQQHDGLIQVSSQPGHGSTFRVYLPLSQERQAEEPPPVPEPPQGGTERILLAEDDPVVRRLTEMLLTDAGYDVISVRDGVQAIAEIDARGEAFDLVVLDVVMPNASGRDVYQHYRKSYPQRPVLFMSGYSTGILGEDFAGKFGASFLSKPFSADSLLHKVREVLA